VFKQYNPLNRNSFMQKYLIVLLCLFFMFKAAAHEKQSASDSIERRSPDTLAYSHLYDVSDVIKDISRYVRKDTSKRVTKKRSGLSILPNLNYNPSIGFQIGAKVVGGHYLGDPENTSMSVFATALSYTTRGILYGYFAHDMYTRENKWNLKGGIVIAKMVGLDYGMGIGNRVDTDSQAEKILN